MCGDRIGGWRRKYLLDYSHLLGRLDRVPRQLDPLAGFVCPCRWCYVPEDRPLESVMHLTATRNRGRAPVLPLRCYNLWMRHSCLGHVPGSGSWRWATEVPSPRYVPLDEARGLYVGDAIGSFAE